MKRILIPLFISLFVISCMINAGPALVLAGAFRHLPRETQKEMVCRVVERLLCPK